jgi:ribosomal protein S18 acetylase RimI-like enzyme
VYDALYLCSALVLPEHRGKGLAGRLTSRAISSLRHDHPIRSLFYWSFSGAGDTLAASVAREFDLPLYVRKA